MRVALLAVAITLAACSSEPDDDRALREAMAGDYTLVSLDGQPLPFETADLVVLSAALHLNASIDGNVLESHTQALPIEPGQGPVGDFRDIGWGPEPGDSIVVNELGTAATRQHRGSVTSDAITLDIRNSVRLPDGRYRFERTP